MKATLKVLKRIVPLVLLGVLTLALKISSDHVRTSSHREIHEKCVAVYIFLGVASGVGALALSCARQKLGLSLGVFAIAHGILLPFLLWPNVHIMGLAVIVIPAIGVVLGLRAVMMQTRGKTHES